MAIAKTMARVMLAGIVLGSAAASAGDAVPPIDALDAASDYSRFMRPDVPHGVRAAALARLWTLDPAIRTGDGPARDGGWNWNSAEGVPGCGIAPGLAEVQATLARLHARLDRGESAPTLAVGVRRDIPGG